MDDVTDLMALPDDGLTLGGGKAVNLARMLRAGLPVPGGFCITTGAYRDVVAPAVAHRVAGLAQLSGAALDAAAAELRDAIVALPLPDGLAAEIAAAYAALGPDVAVAVRSSATAEDLAEASFAGQQDTFLGVVGTAAVLDAVRRCWASLWTDRAVSYRASHGVDPVGLALAVVVQRMVDAEAAGVMFTANPLTGCRTETVIDAAYGLGESVVSGAVNPDRIVARSLDGTILRQNLGDKALAIRLQPGGGVVHEGAPDEGAPDEGAPDEGAPDKPAPDDRRAALTEADVRALVALGRRVERLYGAPMDTEWAVDGQGTPWLTQARPITTLYPAPAARADGGGHRIYLNISLAQGIHRPMTAVGQAAFRHITAGIARTAGFGTPDPDEGARSLEILAGRLFADITTAFRHPLGRRFLFLFFGYLEARSAQVLRQLAEDPAYATDPRIALRTLPNLARLLGANQMPANLYVAATDPDRAAQAVRGIVDAAPRLVATASTATAEQRLDAIEAALGRVITTMPRAAGFFVPGFLGLGLARGLLGDRVRPGELEVVLRGLPHNVTTTMDLELWDRSRELLADPEALAALQASSAAELTQAWHEGRLPQGLADHLTAFLGRWGDRAVAELDLGMPRWRREPTYLLGVLTNYVALPSGPTDPRAAFTRGAEEADAMVATLVARCADAPLRQRAVATCLDRTRRLTGLRESPKFAVIRLLGAVSEQLEAVAAELVARGALAEAADVVHLDFRDMRRGLAGERLQTLVADRRAAYEAELRRRHLPRIVLSDGTDAEAVLTRAARPGELVGTPASSGVVTAAARVVLDPRGARLEPGEILVAPSTDPGWTPLFLTAGGLVMEMGGAVSHGAVVAREYGIPAVVGVPDAVRRIRTGQRITVDGAAGLVRIEDD